jgi:hypothetical protein
MNEDIDLNKPIFICYLDDRKLTPKDLRHYIEESKRILPSNINFLYIASAQPSKIECIWKGNLLESQIINQKNKMNRLLESIENLPESELKIEIRNYILGELIED